MPPRSRRELAALIEALAEWKLMGRLGKYTPAQRALLARYLEEIGEKK